MGKLFLEKKNHTLSTLVRRVKWEIQSAAKYKGPKRTLI